MFCSVDRLSAYLILLSPLQMSPAFTSEYFKNASILAWNKCWIDKLYRVASFSLETLPLQLVTDHFVDKNSIFVSFEKVSRLLLLILTAKIKQYWGKCVYNIYDCCLLIFKGSLQQAAPHIWLGIFSRQIQPPRSVHILPVLNRLLGLLMCKPLHYGNPTEKLFSLNNLFKYLIINLLFTFTYMKNILFIFSGTCFFPLHDVWLLKNHLDNLFRLRWFSGIAAELDAALYRSNIRRTY